MVRKMLQLSLFFHPMVETIFHIFQSKYLNILKSRHIYLRSKIAQDKFAFWKYYQNEVNFAYNKKKYLPKW